MRYPILALLAEKPAHGYELKQAFDDRFGAVWPPINVGQIYNTLSALERHALVKSEDVPQRGAPPRRVYELTDEGRRSLDEWVTAPSSNPTLKEESILKLVLAHVAGVADPMALVDQQRQEYFKTIREPNALAARQENDTSSKLLIGGASLYVQALLRWMDLCEEVFTGSTRDGGGAA
jgi:DNA-binding PadR family transcriptional regulator